MTKQQARPIGVSAKKATTQKASSFMEDLIDSITRNLSVPYFGKMLKSLAAASQHNAKIICEHISAEQTQDNAKPSTTYDRDSLIILPVI